MKKRILNIFICFVVCVGTILTLLIPCVPQTFVKATSETNSNKQVLINPNIESQQWVDDYGGKLSDVSNFTPFDYDTNKRLDGVSILPEGDEFNQIPSVTYNLAANGGLSKSNSLSFGLWIYFADVSIHALSIKLCIDENNFLSLNLSKTQLIELLKKTTFVTEQAFAWNYLEVPINENSIVGNIYDDDVLKEFKYVTISYTGTEVTEGMTFSSFRFYGLYLHESTVNEIKCTEKQDYTIYSFNFWDRSQLSSIVKGDKLKLPSLVEAVNYAWVGSVNLLSMNQHISWQVIVTTPSGENKNYNFGDTITFNDKGEYTVSYRAQSRNSSIEANLYDYVYVYVRSDNLVYFNFSSYKVEKDKSTTINLNFDGMLDQISTQVESIIVENENIASVESKGDFAYEVTGNKQGETILTIKLKARRLGSSEIKEYTASTTIRVYEAGNSNAGAITFIWIMLGVILVAGVIAAIITIIKVRRNDVK